MRKLIENRKVMALPNIETKKIFGNLTERCRGRFPTLQGRKVIQHIEIYRKTNYFSILKIILAFQNPRFPTGPPQACWVVIISVKIIFFKMEK